MPRICLLALIGLPAAGKTNLSNYLLENQSNLSDWNILHLCYDDYFDVASNEDYKQQRNYIFEMLIQLIDKLENGKLNELPTKIRRSTNNNNDSYLIICDDNHYYRSMRYKLYQLSRSKCCIYAQIYIRQTLNSCLQSNEKRGLIVPSTIIQQMHARLEEPSADNAWEYNSLTINHLDFNVICEFIKPLLHLKIDEEPQNLPKLKQQQLQALPHQLDLLLRARIQIQMQDKSTVTLGKPAKSRALNEKRKQILAQFRQDNSNFNKQTAAVNDLQLEYYVNLLN